MDSPLKSLSNSLRFLFIALFFLLSTIDYRLSANSNQELSHVRVAVLQDATSFRLKVNGPYNLVDAQDNKLLYSGNNINTTVTAYKYGILLGEMKAGTKRLLIKAVDSDITIVNGRKFRGDIVLIRNNAGKLLVVNCIGLEEYVKGILYHEVSHFWPMEALKAQAIVCRTYAAYQMRENALKDYDLTSDIYSQVYGGRTSERYRTNNAVDQTKDLMLAYQGRIFSAYYHATCAGHTEDASLLWNTDIAPLKGVPCDFCKGSPHFNWHYVLSLKELKDKLSEGGYKIKGSIKDLAILGIDDSGRIRDIKIMNAGEDLIIPAKDFRNVISPNIIRSTKFTVNVAGDDAVLEGFGWGHGVGLCQWGAYFMAKAGYKYDEILKYYYPESQIIQKE